MNEFYRLKKFAAYQWRSKTKYYLHSPFVYQFYLHVLEPQPHENLGAIGLLRKELSNNHTEVNIQDFGTGPDRAISLSALEKQVAVKEKYGAMLYRLVQYFKPKNIVELGTSTGLSSAYMALANPNARVFTVEGDTNLANLAQQHFKKLQLQNIEIIRGSFDTSLPPLLDKLPAVDLVFFDGNHQKNATLQYFRECLSKVNENSIFIFDDIYYSPDMDEAWQEIKAHPGVRLTLDMFQMGICFFMKEKLAKEDFMLRY